MSQFKKPPLQDCKLSLVHSGHDISVKIGDNEIPRVQGYTIVADDSCLVTLTLKLQLIREDIEIRPENFRLL